jgi:hypothetical protein
LFGATPGNQIFHFANREGVNTRNLRKTKKLPYAPVYTITFSLSVLFHTYRYNFTWATPAHLQNAQSCWRMYVGDEL